MNVEAYHMPHTLSDPNVFIENTNRLLPQALQDFSWQHVAWSLDGTEILAHAPTLKELYEQVDDRRITDFVVDFLMPEDGPLPEFGSEISGHTVAAEVSTEPTA